MPNTRALAAFSCTTASCTACFFAARWRTTRATPSTKDETTAASTNKDKGGVSITTQSKAFRKVANSAEKRTEDNILAGLAILDSQSKKYRFDVAV